MFARVLGEVSCATSFIVCHDAGEVALFFTGSIPRVWEFDSVNLTLAMAVRVLRLDETFLCLKFVGCAAFCLFFW